MSKSFYYDYFSLKNADIQEWHEEFFWPVPRETTTQITLDFKEEHCQIINELAHTFEGDCFLIGHIISHKFIEVVNHYLSVQRIQEKGCSIRFSDKLKLIPLLLSRNDNIYFERENIWSMPYRMPLPGQMVNCAFSVKYNFKKNSYQFPHHFLPRKNIFSFKTDNVRNRAFTKSQKEWIHFTSAEEWLRPSLGQSPSLNTTGKFKEISREYVNFSKNYLASQFALNLPDPICRALFDYTIDYLTHIAIVYTALKARAKEIRPCHLLTPTAGKTFVRMLSLAVRKEGCKVTGFPHGYYICHYQSPKQALHEFATVDEFMAYTPGSVPLFYRNLAMNPPPRENPVKIVHENTPFFLNLWNSWKDRPLPKKIKTVMVLELSLILEWAGYHCAELMMNYHFYYSLCKALSDHGYKVIFKKRPKSLGWDGFNIFRDIPNMTIIDDLYEKPGVIELADAVFIQYAMSSTLYWSMCTNKTVIYVDAGWEPWFNDVYELMAKRCRILHCWYDERNRQMFDKGELLKILETPPETPNMEFIEKYLFPK